jgi:hypothetical protein
MLRYSQPLDKTSKALKDEDVEEKVEKEESKED